MDDRWRHRDHRSRRARAEAANTTAILRLTTDTDAVVQGDAVTVEKVVEALGQHQIVPRIDDAVPFAEENLVLLVRHRPTGVDLDVSFGWTSFEVEALRARAKARFGWEAAPMAIPRTLSS